MQYPNVNIWRKFDKFNFGESGSALNYVTKKYKKIILGSAYELSSDDVKKIKQYLLANKGWTEFYSHAGQHDGFSQTFYVSFPVKIDGVQYKIHPMISIKQNTDNTVGVWYDNYFDKKYNEAEKLRSTIKGKLLNPTSLGYYVAKLDPPYTEGDLQKVFFATLQEDDQLVVYSLDFKLAWDKPTVMENVIPIKINHDKLLAISSNGEGECVVAGFDSNHQFFFISNFKQVEMTAVVNIIKKLMPSSIKSVYLNRLNGFLVLTINFRVSDKGQYLQAVLNDKYELIAYRLEEGERVTYSTVSNNPYCFCIENSSKSPSPKLHQLEAFGGEIRDMAIISLPGSYEQLDCQMVLDNWPFQRLTICILHEGIITTYRYDASAKSHPVLESLGEFQYDITKGCFLSANTGNGGQPTLYARRPGGGENGPDLYMFGR
jgi:hypothetical protein